MSSEVALGDIVTEFLLNTCRLCQRSTSEHAIYAAFDCAIIASRYAYYADNKDDAEGVAIPLTTGSVAEFYIEPMLTHIGDIDVMFHRGCKLAIPRGHRPPTQLPAEFHNYVRVYEIVDSHIPGYVYLPLRYLLTECSDDDNFNAVEYYNSGICITTQPNSELAEMHGPALVDRPNRLSVDEVRCVRCLSWPPQAADWPTRHRNYDWPDSATVDRVVNSGCDVVRVAHRQCTVDNMNGWASLSGDCHSHEQKLY